MPYQSSSNSNQLAAFQQRVISTATGIPQNQADKSVSFVFNCRSSFIPQKAENLQPTFCREERR